MKYCRNCGSELQDDVTICPNCGTESRVSNASKPTIESIKSTVKDTVAKTVDTTKELGQQVNNKVKEHKEAVHEQVQQEAADLEKKRERKKVLSNEESTKFMSSTELWSWLKQSAKRQIFVSKDVSVDAEQYVDMVMDKIEKRNVPATIEKKSIEWDRVDIKKVDYYVKPNTDAVNPLTYLLQFNYVGEYAFVEQKSFITPPDLPNPPMRRLPIDEAKKALCELLGKAFMIVIVLSIALLFMGSSVAILGLFIAGGIFAAGYFLGAKNREIEEHNAEVLRQEIAWNKAWQNWETSIFQHSFQEDINGKLSRIYDAVFECVKEVNKELFSEQEPVQQQEISRMNDLEEAIARRKEEYR